MTGSIPAVAHAAIRAEVRWRVWTSSPGPVTRAIRRLLAPGHRRIARVPGPGEPVHTRHRTSALIAACATAGIEPVIVEGDYAEASGLAQTRRLLSVAEPPTAIMYDNDVMALGGLTAADRHPPLTVMAVDVHRYGLT